MQTNPAGTDEEAHPPRLSRRDRIFVGALGAFLVALVITSLVRIVFGNESRATESHRKLITCSSPDCTSYDIFLQATLNTSLDPCNDFKAFVTSRWLPDPAIVKKELWKIQWDVKYLWMRLLADEIRHRRFAVPVMGLVAASYEACENHAADNSNKTRWLFKKLLRDLEAPWPESPILPTDALDIVIKLCVQWQIPLWFDIKMLPEKTAGDQKIIYIGPSWYAKFWSAQYEKLDREDKVSDYIGRYLKYFKFPLEPDEVTATVNYFMVFNITRNFSLKLAKLCSSRSEIFTLDVVAQMLNVSTTELTSVLNKYFRPRRGFSPNDAAIIKARGIITAARAMLTYPSNLIQNHLGWWMLEIFAPLADDDFFIYKYGTKTMGDSLRPLFCVTEVETSLKLAILANHIALNFAPNVRHDIDRILRDVRETAAIAYEASGLPREQTKRIAQKLRQMKINLWPRAEYLSGENLTRLYGSRKSRHRTDLEHWIAQRRANNELIGSEAYFELTRLPHSFFNEPLAYDSVLNSATMSILVVHKPFYYRDAFAAVNYGGLGAIFMKEVLRGISSDPGIDEVHPKSFRFNQSLLETNGNESCSEERTTGRQSILFALQAYQRSKARVVPNVWDYPPEAFFFINYCHAQSRLEAAFDCNSVLQGLQSFVDAFRCSAGSGMNPQPKDTRN